MRLSDMSGFHHESDLPHNIHSHEMRFVRTDPYHFMLVGGETVHWKGRSTRSWLRWNDENLRVVAPDANMLYTHHHAPAVAVPVSKARIKSCTEPYALPAP